MEPQLKTVTFIVNPRARGVSKGFEPEKAARYIEKQGVTCRLVIPDSAEAVGRTARESAERGDDALLVIGGDGTQRDAAQGLGTSEGVAQLEDAFQAVGVAHVLPPRPSAPGGH